MDHGGLFSAFEKSENGKALLRVPRGLDHGLNPFQIPLFIPERPNPSPTPIAGIGCEQVLYSAAGVQEKVVPDFRIVTYARTLPDQIVQTLPRCAGRLERPRRLR